MGNRTINIAVVAEIAKALRELKNQMVFIYLTIPRMKVVS